MIGTLVADRDLADPLCIGFGPTKTSQTVFITTRRYAGVAVIGALVGINQKPPTYFGVNGLIGRSGIGHGVQQDAWSDRNACNSSGTLADELTAIVVYFVFLLIHRLLPAVDFGFDA